MTVTKYFTAIILVFSAMCAKAQTSRENLEELVTKAAEQSNRPAYSPLVKDAAELSLLLSADSLAIAEKNVAAQAAITENLGYYYYTQAPDKSIRYAEKAYTLFITTGNNTRAAQCLHNIAFAYDEQKHNIPEAAKYAKLAIQARTALNDTLSMANMYKYLGYLQGKMHDFPVAEKNIKEAIRLFTLKKYMAGAAVSYHNLALVYEEEHKPDSCIANILFAKKIWIAENNDTNRLFDANNILLRVYTAENRLTEAEQAFHDNESMMNGTAMQNMTRSAYELLDYYKISQAFFSKKNDDKMVKEYVAKYATLKESMEKEGRHVD